MWLHITQHSADSEMEYWLWTVFIYVHLPCILEMLFWQFHLIMQVTANVFITAIHGLRGDTQLWQVPKVLLRHPLRHGLLCQCSLFVRLGGQKESSLSDFMRRASTRAVLQ